MATLEIVQADYEGALLVFDDLRREDSMEIARFGPPEELLTELLATSEAWIAKLDGKIACVWGVRPAESPIDPAFLWLITTNLINTVPVCMARESAKFVYKALYRWGVLEGWVLVENERSQRWLKWLGFSLGEPFELPPVGLVRKFQMRL